jgi:hypothetical protein
MKSVAGPPPHVVDSPSLPRHTRSSLLLLGRCLHQLRKKCADTTVVYSRAEHIFNVEHNFALKLIYAVSEAFSDACAGKASTKKKRQQDTNM